MAKKKLKFRGDRLKKVWNQYSEFDSELPEVKAGQIIEVAPEKAAWLLETWPHLWYEPRPKKRKSVGNRTRGHKKDVTDPKADKNEGGPGQVQKG